MDEYKAMGSVADKLLNFIDNTRAKDVNYEIAIEMIKNYGELKKLTITEVADLCFVSTSTISRFCKFIGFNNFSEFKHHLDMEFSVRDDYSKSLYSLLKSDLVNATKEYRNILVENLDNTLIEENFTVLEKVAKEMKNSNRMAYFASHFLWHAGRYFQGKMILMDKYVEQFFDMNDQMQCAQSLDENSLVIVASVEGSYMTRYPSVWTAIRKSGAKIVLITQNIHSAQCNAADYIIKCGNSNRDSLGRYAVMMVIDLMIMTYLSEYDK